MKGSEFVSSCKLDKHWARVQLRGLVVQVLFNETLYLVQNIVLMGHAAHGGRRMVYTWTYVPIVPG